MTRNQVKAQEERRRLRKLRWLSEGGANPRTPTATEARISRAHGGDGVVVGGGQFYSYRVLVLLGNGSHRIY